MSYLVEIIADSGKGDLTFEAVEKAVAEHEFLRLHSSAKEVIVPRAGNLEGILSWNETEKSLVCKNPESDVLAVMIHLAKYVGGRVRGEQLETYRTPFEIYEHPDDAAELERQASAFRKLQKKSSRKGLFTLVAWLLGPAAVICLLNLPALWPRAETFSAATPEEQEALIANAHLGEKAEIILVPLGNFSFQFLGELALQTNRMTGLQIRVATSRQLPNIEPYPGSQQFDAVKIVSSQALDISFLRQRYGDGVIVYFTNQDINQGESRQGRFVFAHHDFDNRIAVISASRLARGQGISYAPVNVIRERILKYTLRAIGEHHLSLPRVEDKESIMRSPVKGLTDVDQLGFKPFPKPGE